MGRHRRVLVGMALVALTACGDIYEGHRGKFPANYKEKIRAVIESKWPEPRMFRVLAVSTPNDGFILTTEAFPAKYGAWLGCVELEGDRKRGADFDILFAPYAIASGGALLVLEDEPNCHEVPLQPWPDMRDNSAV
jgi:hypothetical protein